MAGNGVSAATQWGTVVLLARLGSAAMLGQYALGLAICSPAFLLAGLSLRTVQATDVRGEFDFSDYLTLRLLSVAVAFLAVVLILGVANLREETTLVVLAVAMTKSFESLSDICYGLRQQQERMDQIAKSMIGRGVISVLAAGALLYTGRGIVWSAFALSTVAACGALFYDLRAGGTLPPLRWRTSNLWRMTRIALPLGVITMLVTLNTNMPRYFLGQARTEREIGIFAALSYIVFAANIVVMAFGQAASPKMARFHAFGNRTRLVTLGAKLVAIAAALGTAGIVMAKVGGGTLLGLLYGPEYAAQSRLFELLMWVGALTLVSSAMGYILASARCFAKQIPMFVAVTAVTAWGCWRLIPGQGLWGAAEAQLWGVLLQIGLSAPLLVLVLLHTRSTEEEAPAKADRAPVSVAS